MENMKIWNSVKQPPQSALKQIIGGRMRGKTDINPQWRIQSLTEQFGPCGIGWKYEIVRLWNEPAAGEQTFAFSEIKLYIKYQGEWSEAIPGIGGSMLVEQEKNGIHSNDEAYKMATTDALSVAMKQLGVAADIYLGFFDGSKYNIPNVPQKEQTQPENIEKATPEDVAHIKSLIAQSNTKLDSFCTWAGISRLEELPLSMVARAVDGLQKKIKKSTDEEKSRNVMDESIAKAKSILSGAENANTN